MGLFDKLRSELVDIVEWMSDDPHTVVYRFPRYRNEIKHGAQLIVRPGQVAVFVHQGKLADVFEEGRYELKTDNLPLLSTLQGWKHGFQSPFKSEVYFVSTRQIRDLKWGTPKPIIMRDADFGRVRVRAFGTYTLRVIDPKILIRELVGTDGQFVADELTELIRSIIQSAFADTLGEAKIPVLDLASSYTELSQQLKKHTNERIDDEYGLELPLLKIVNISLPEEVEKALDTHSSMAAIGDMQKFQQFQMANAIPALASGGGGGAGSGVAEGMGLGVGMAMAGQMANMMGNAFPQAQGGAGAMTPPPPPPPAPAAWHISINGQTQGPFSIQQLAQGVAQGQINAHTMVWTAGMAGWQPAGQVPQLASIFTAPPPPPPPPPAG